MKLHQIRDFVAVAATGSLRAGARRLGLTQPTLTKSIQQLEKELGTTLFDRHGRGAVLSAAGRAFLPRAQSALNELERGATELKHLGGNGGSVNMALSTAMSLSVFPQVLADFRRAFPAASIRVISGSYPVMIPALRSGALDFSIGPRPSFPLADDFVVELLFTNTRCVVGRKGHPLQHAHSLRALTQALWVVSGVTGTPAAEHDQLFANLGLPVPQSVVQSEYVAATLALLAGSDALTFMPRQWVEAQGLRDVFTQIPVEEPLPGVDIVLVMRRDLPLTQPAANMLMLFRRHIEYYLRDPGPAAAPGPPRRPSRQVAAG